MHKMLFLQVNLTAFIYSFLSGVFMQSVLMALILHVWCGMPWMMEEWNLSALQAGAVGSYSLFGMMIGALVLSPMADKFGRKNVIVLCMFLFSVFTLAAGLAPNIVWFTVMRFIAALEWAV